MVPLKAVVNLANGCPFDSERFDPVAGTPLIRIRDLTAGRTETCFDGDVPEGVMVGDGDLLIGMDGDFAAVVWQGGPAALNQRLCRIRARPGTSERYLAYVLPIVLNAINDVTYSTTVKHLSSVDLLNERVPLPPVHRQNAIAEFLDTETGRIDPLIAQRRAMTELLAERRARVTLGGVAGDLTSCEPRVPSPMPWLREIPRTWRPAKLNLIAHLGSGHTPSRSEPSWWVAEDCTIPWITTGEVAQMRSDRIEYVEDTREGISPIGLANSAAEIHPTGTVVLCRTASAGFSAIMGTDMATSQDFATWTCGPLLRPRFLLLCLRAMRQDLLGRLAMGSTHKTIYMPDIESIRVPLPPVEEQGRIVDAVWKRLHDVDAAVDAINRQIALLQERKQALITAAVTGQLDVTKGAA